MISNFTGHRPHFDRFYWSHRLVSLSHSLWLIILDISFCDVTICIQLQWGALWQFNANHDQDASIMSTGTIRIESNIFAASNFICSRLMEKRNKQIPLTKVGKNGPFLNWVLCKTPSLRNDLKKSTECAMKKWWILKTIKVFFWNLNSWDMRRHKIIYIYRPMI